MVTFNPEFYLFGREGESTIYIEDNLGEMTEILSYESFKIIKQQNQMSSFEVKITDVESSEKLYIKELKKIFFFSGGKLILKGRIQNVIYDSISDCYVTGYGFVSSKLLEKEFTKNNNVTAVWDDIKRAQYENISAQTIAKEVLSENSDGNAPYIVDITNSGLFSSDWGEISMRYENANRLNCLAKLSEAINYEWSEEANQDDFDESPISIAEYLPSIERATNSQQTFKVSGEDANAEETNKSKDVSMLINKVDGLGYGDGINQLRTSCYNASAIYSILTEDITETQDTITLADASSFPSTGTIRIMEEQVTYTGKSGNSLTGCTRGANSTTARSHKKTIFVEKHLEISNAEEGSSIYEYGLMDKSIFDKSIINMETLELIISKELLNKMEPIETITILPIDTDITLENRMIGDLVTIVDTESGISGNYRIVSIIYTSDYGDLSIELQCSNRSLTFIDQMAKAKEESTNLSKYMQGATNIFSVQSYENCSNDYPLYLRFYIPEDAVAINNISLNFKTEKFRAYSSATEVNSESSSISSTGSAGSGVSPPYGSWTTACSVSVPNTDCEGTYISASADTIDSGSGSSGTYGLKMRIYDGTNYYPDANGLTHYISSIWNNHPAINGYISELFPGNNKQKTYSLQVSSSVNGVSPTLNTHIIQTSFSRHTHNVGYGISENTFPLGSPKIKIEIDDGNEYEWTECSGSPLEISSGGTYSSDITEEVRNVGVGKWVTIRLTPMEGTNHNNIRVEANIICKVFIQSK